LRDRRHRFFPYWPYWPYGYYEYDDYYPDTTGYYGDDTTGQGYSDYSTETQRVPVQAPREVYPVYDTVPAVGALVVSSTLLGSRTMVRLTWRDRGLGAKQVAFFLADSARNVLTAEDVRSPPFTALLEAPSETAYAGMTVVLPGGVVESQYVPYRGQAR
jgi:hypothetical protein